jgi:hypothetical protein
VREKAALREFREYFSFVFNSLLCVCELRFIEAFEFKWFCLYYSFVLHSFVSEFFMDHLY